MNKTLVYGYGNPGRQDDALGVLIAEEIELWAAAKGIEWIAVDSDYQLNIEDAATIAEYDRIVFADASREEDLDSFRLNKLKPSAQVEFTMHAVSPSFILHLSESIYDRHPEAWLLHIKGYEWELQEGLSPMAAANFNRALQSLKEFLLPEN